MHAQAYSLGGEKVVPVSVPTEISVEDEEGTTETPAETPTLGPARRSHG